MKVELKLNKDLRQVFSIEIDKKIIQEKLNERLLQLQSEVNLKGFRPGKVPANVIKNQFGKAIYGEVIDKILKDSSSKVLNEKKIKVAGQPKIDLKSFAEGKNLNYELQVDLLPNIKLQPFDNFKATEYKVKIEDKIIKAKIQEIASQHKKYKDKNDNANAELSDQVIFDYSAKVDGNKFEGSEGKGVQLELGKDLFLKGFDNQLVGVKKGQTKKIESILPSNHPKKELANKKAFFECKILNVKMPEQNTIDDNFAKEMGAKDLTDLKKLIENQISSQYVQALSSITKKEILDQINNAHEVTLPKNLIENELVAMTQNLKQEEKDKHKISNEKLAKSRIKLGLILNELGEKNNLKINDDEVKAEVQKQIKSMPGQEKMVLEYYQKNPNAAQSLKGALYEEKIINLVKSKIKLLSKTISTSEAEKIISNFNEPKNVKSGAKKSKSLTKDKVKSKKISKK